MIGRKIEFLQLLGKRQAVSTHAVLMFYVKNLFYLLSYTSLCNSRTCKRISDLSSKNKSKVVMELLIKDSSVIVVSYDKQCCGLVERI